MKNFSGKFSYAYRYIDLNKIENVIEIEVWEGDKKFSLGEGEGSYIVDYKSNKVFVKWFYNARDEERTFTLKYKVHGAINYYSNFDELYWKAIFQDREKEVKNARVVVYFPKNIEVSQLRAELYTGATNSEYYFQNGNLVFLGENLPPYSDFEVRIQFPKGVVEKNFI